MIFQSNCELSEIWHRFSKVATWHRAPGRLWCTELSARVQAGYVGPSGRTTSCFTPWTEASLLRETRLVPWRVNIYQTFVFFYHMDQTWSNMIKPYQTLVLKLFFYGVIFQSSGFIWNIKPYPNHFNSLNIFPGFATLFYALIQALIWVFPHPAPLQMVFPHETSWGCSTPHPLKPHLECVVRWPPNDGVAWWPSPGTVLGKRQYCIRCGYVYIIIYTLFMNV